MTTTTSNRAPRLDLASPGRTVLENIELATLAENAGWRGFWVAEATGADAVATASAVAARLESIRVGTAILPMQTRDPLLLAMAATSVGQIAPGGFVLGLGTSTPLIIEDWHATPWGASPLQLTRSVSISSADSWPASGSRRTPGVGTTDVRNSQRIRRRRHPSIWLRSTTECWNSLARLPTA